MRLRIKNQPTDCFRKSQTENYISNILHFYRDKNLCFNFGGFSTNFKLHLQSYTFLWISFFRQSLISMYGCMYGCVCVSLRCTEYGEFMFSYGPWMYYNKPTWNTSSEALLMTAIQFYSDFSYFSQYFSTQHTEWPSSIFWYLLLVMVCSYFTVSERREEKTKKKPTVQTIYMLM